jgi:hypothetical protein
MADSESFLLLDGVEFVQKMFHCGFQTGGVAGSRFRVSEIWWEALDLFSDTWFSIMSFMWAVGINATSSVLLGTPRDVGGYGFGPWALGYIYFAPIIGIFIGEIIGHWGNDVSISSQHLIFILHIGRSH